MAQAASNLCVLLSKDRLEEALSFCRDAVRLRPDDPKVAYTLGFTLNQKGDAAEAIATLEAIIEKHPGYRDAQMLLREISRTAQKP